MITQKTIKLKITITGSGTKSDVCKDLRYLINGLRSLSVSDIELGTTFEYTNLYADVSMEDMDLK